MLKAFTKRRVCTRSATHAAEAIYVAEVDPCTMANVIIDNSDFANPKILSVGEG